MLESPAATGRVRRTGGGGEGAGGLAVFQAGRAGEVEGRAAAYAREHGLDEAFLVRLSTC